MKIIIRIAFVSILALLQKHTFGQINSKTFNYEPKNQIFSTSKSFNEKVFQVKSQTLNIRSQPNVSSAIVGTLAYNEEVTVKYIENDEWLEIVDDNIAGYVYSKYIRPKLEDYSDWERKNYYSGETPECENVSPQFDYEIDNVLRIKVGSNTDVVVKLMKIGYPSDECIRIVYVRAGDTYDIKNIPEEKYYLKLAYGKDYRQKIIDNQCIVKFVKDAFYKKGTEILNFNKKPLPDKTIGNTIYKRWDIPSYELELNIIKMLGDKSNFNSNNISEEDFNK